MYTYKNILSGVFILAQTSLWAQTTLSGKISDGETQLPVGAASVHLSDLNVGTLSDSTGTFTFRNLKAGTYLVEIKKKGYKTLAQKITLPLEAQPEFILSPSVTEISEVVITGVSRSTEIKKNPVSMLTIGEEALRTTASTNIVDALTQTPGISQISTGGAISKPVIRGLGYNRVLVLYNGIRQEGQQWGDEHGVEIDENSVNRVEVIKGPGSLMYGSDGLAGVINFLPPQALPEGEVQSQLNLNYQSNNALAGYSISHSENKRGIRWSGLFSNKFTGNYSNKYDGKVFNSGSKEWNGRLSAGVHGNWGHLNVAATTFNTDLGIVEGERNESGKFIYEDKSGEEQVAEGKILKGYRLYTPYQKVGHHSVTSQAYFILPKGTLSTDLGYQLDLRREFEEAETPDEPGLSLNLQTLTYSVKYNFQKKNGWETSIGLSGMYQDNQNKGSEFLIPDYRLFDVGGFIFTQKDWGKFTLAGGVRYDHRDIHALPLEEPSDSEPEKLHLRFAEFRRGYGNVSGSAGISYRMNSHQTFKFNLSQGFRAPNISELAANGIHEGTFRYEIGNERLKPEVSRQVDWSYELTSKHLTLQFSPFLNFIRNYIYLRKADLSELPPQVQPDPETPYYLYTSGRAFLWGGEFYLDLHPHPLDWIHWENSFAWVRGTQKHVSADLKDLPFMPAPKYHTGLKFEFKTENSQLQHPYARIGLDYYFKQNHFLRAFDTETATPDYALVNIGLGTEIQWKQNPNKISISLSVQNLFNKTYQSHLSRLKYAPVNELTGRAGVFNRGRNASINVGITL